MLNDKTNKLLIFQSSRSIQEQLNDKAHTYAHSHIHRVYGTSAHSVLGFRVQTWAQSNHSSVNILYYNNYGYAFNCACHKRDIYTKIQT